MATTIDRHGKKKEKIVFGKGTLILVIAAVLFVLAAGGVAIYMYMTGAFAKGEFVIEDKDGSEENSTYITKGTQFLDDQKYVYNEHLTNYLFLGIDKDTLEQVEVGSAEAGQTDAIYLLSIDRVTGESHMVSIPRDTMTRIATYPIGGKNPVYRYDHLSICYGFGDGRYGSCEMTKEAVSNLLCHLPIQNYCAIGLDSLGVLAKRVDGVTVTVPENDGGFPEDTFTPGEELEITPDNIEKFLRTRDINTSQSALFRLDRQKLYLESLLDRCEEKYTAGPGFITDLYLDLKNHMVTNMTTDQFVDIMEAIEINGGIEEWTIPGEGVETDLYDEYHVDQQALYRKLIETCCVPEE